MGGLLGGGGGGKGYVGPPPLKLLGGGCPPRPPPPSSYAYENESQLFRYHIDDVFGIGAWQTVYAMLYALRNFQ